MPTANVNYPCDLGEPVDIIFYGSAKITGYADSAPQEKAELVFPLGTRKSYRFQSGLLSARDNILRLRSRQQNRATVLLAQAGMGTVGILVHVNGRPGEHRMDNVLQIDIFADRVVVFYEAQTPPDPTLVTPAPTGEMAALKKQNEKLKEQVKQATEIMNGLKNSTRELLNENNQLKHQNAALQSAVSQGVDDLIDAVRNGQAAVGPELRARMEELDELRSRQAQQEGQANDIEQKIREQKRRNAATEAELAELNGQLASLRSQEEVERLDCSRAKETLEALRIRLQMDGDIVTLSESRWLKNNSVTDTLEEMEQKLSALEDRIGLILNARELYNTAVQSAVLLSGDGTISADDENGNHNQDFREDTDSQN